jgi:MFS family permease
LLGWISLATDAATEAIYPILPFFLTQILGASALSLGIVEGAAEAVNSALKILSGRVADRRTIKRPLVLLGYGISSAVRPLIGLAQSWTHVLAVRVADRVGKGIRGAPRDAMLASFATPETRGRIYGFHRGMDHVGAIIGPILASAFLSWHPGEYRTLFALTIVPGAIAVLLILLINEDPARTADPGGTQRRRMEASVGDNARRPSPAGSDSAFNPDDSPLPLRLPESFKHFMLVLALFTLGNSTDAFLLLKLTDAAGGARFIPLMWAALHAVKASVSILCGGLSDRLGRRPVISMGWLTYAVVYAGFAASNTLPALLAWFLVYGFYFGLSEGAEKALVADLAPASRRGVAFGWYTAVQGLGALAASLIFGAIWSAAGAAAAFLVGAGLALAATVLLYIAIPPRTIESA